MPNREPKEEKVTISKKDVGKLVLDEGEVDPFEGHEPIPGYEQLGRVIRDSRGQLSGSPANYEATRGVTADSLYTPLSEDEEEELLNYLLTQIPPEVG